MCACFNTQPPEGGWLLRNIQFPHHRVSTHSRPKAAGTVCKQTLNNKKGFNTQPPEGGWTYGFITGYNYIVSTHSRPKAAGWWRLISETYLRRFNTQPPEGGWWTYYSLFSVWVRFQHTAARRRLDAPFGRHYASSSGFNTQPPEGGWDLTGDLTKNPLMFQHTAARRRLGRIIQESTNSLLVSTHSRPKAAGLTTSITN